MATMATYESLSAELIKFKKETLIEIIINKKSPAGLTISEHLGKHIGLYENCEKNKLNPEECDLTYQNKSVEVGLKHELEIAKMDLQHTKRLVTELERTINYQKEIIDLLKNSQSSQNVGDVANVNLASQKKGKNKKNENITTEKKEDKKIQETTTSEIGKIKETSKVTKTVGNNTDQHQSFAAAAKKAWLCISKIKIGTQSEVIEEHLKNKFPGNDFTIEELPRHKEATSMSFKLGADMELLTELNKPETWPKGIYIKRFRFFRSNNAKFGDETN